MKKLAIIITHPIQYYSPFFKKLAETEGLNVKVFYTWDKGAGEKHDPGFGVSVEWDIPLLEGYAYTFVKNISKNPGSSHHKGIVCPTLNAEIEAYAPSAILIYGWNFDAHLKAMRYFKGKIPVWFRGDSTLLDYDYRTVGDLVKYYLRCKSQEPRTSNLKPRTSNLKQEFGNPEPVNPPTPLKGGLNTRATESSELPTSNIEHQTSNIEHRTLNPEPRTSKLQPLLSFLRYRIRKLYLTRIYKNIDKAFYVGTNNKNYYLAHGLKEEQLVHMPHAVDNDFFSRNHEAREQEALEWRRSLGIADDDFVVLFAGKFEFQKNPLLLLNAIIKVNEHQNDSRTKASIQLILLGNGFFETQMKKLAVGKPYIHFVPFQNQTKMPIVYRLGNVYCLPSLTETWGLAVNESLACKRKVIVSHKVGCAPNLIKEGNGFIFQSNNLNELVLCICNAFKTKKNLCQGISDEYSINYQCDVIVKTINK